MATDQQTAALTAGDDALRRGVWEEARGHFDAAIAAEESAAAWEGLGWAAYWLSDADLTLRARETAYRAFRAAGDPAGAGRVAGWLASDFLEFRGEDAVASGWLERAHRMLDDLPECAEHGWLALHEGGYVMNVRGDLDATAELADRATTVGRKLGVADLEGIGLALKGITLVRRGSVEVGMRLLDEGAVVAASEDLQWPLSRGWALCYLISACEGVGDFPRAVQWCQTARPIADRWGARQMLGICRSAYGNVLATNGDWAAGELELTAAVGDLQAARPAMAGGALARLGELRARQGRADEARALFESAGNHPRAVVGLGSLALHAGDPAAATDAAERVLRRLSPAAVLDRLPALELLVRARVALGELEAAADGSAELERIGAELGTPYVRGRARLVAGQTVAARGDQEQARRVCEDAVDLLVEAGATYETALARFELARALAALGRDEPAAMEAAVAREAFAALGAERDVARVDTTFGDGSDVGRADDVAGRDVVGAGHEGVGDPRSLAELTPRELEVLRLVALGLGDAEIAARLVVSQHTVHRHVANVRVKLRLPSRAAAVAYAARAGLL
jgi:DNA-binding CsgD family transcriptional regulator/tetratricopeptide (TPR) repeat protein